MENFGQRVRPAAGLCQGAVVCCLQYGWILYGWILALCATRGYYRASEKRDTSRLV
jgi:hypothetical protein